MMSRGNMQKQVGTPGGRAKGSKATGMAKAAGRGSAKGQEMRGFGCGGKVKKYAKGGKIDGIAKRGKTRCKHL